MNEKYRWFFLTYSVYDILFNLDLVNWRRFYDSVLFSKIFQVKRYDSQCVGYCLRGVLSAVSSSKQRKALRHIGTIRCASNHGNHGTLRSLSASPSNLPWWAFSLSASSPPLRRCDILAGACIPGQAGGEAQGEEHTCIDRASCVSREAGSVESTMWQCGQSTCRIVWCNM